MIETDAFDSSFDAEQGGLSGRLIGAESKSSQEEAIERALRPKRLADYVDQAKIREQLSIFIHAAKRRSEALDHVLLFGPPGLGKTTLAHIVAAEMGVNLRQTSGPVLERAGDLAGAVARQEAGRLTKVPGIGKKTAERLLLELKDKLAPVVGGGAAASLVVHDDQADILNALLALGYNEREAGAALKQLPAGTGVSDGIRQALKLLAKP